jgi:hypothetical protein
MQDVDLFLSLAEIAGVFVGFGALIAVRSGGSADVFDVTYVGMVVWFAIIVVVVSLAPVAISRFGVTDRELWVVCGVLAVVLWWAGDSVVARVSAERRAFMAAQPLRVRWKGELAGAALWGPANVAFVLAALGVFPGQEPALYFAGAVLLLFMDAGLLLATVFRVRPAG